MALAATGTDVGAEGRIPLFATRPAIEGLLPAVADRQRQVLESGRYILGPEVEAFEHEFAASVGRRHCVGVANGTDAITIALKAYGIGSGDEVIVPGVTFFATAEAVVNAGARPVVADLDPHTHCVTAETVAAKLSSRTRAVLPVHLFGNPAPMVELAELAADAGLTLIGDAAQAAGARLHGRPAAAFGDAATFSFYPGKNLGAFGDAGAIVTDDDEIDTRARRLRAHGEGTRRWEHTDVGFNSRLDELQAAALRVLLPHLDGWGAQRRRVAEAYGRSGLADLVQIPVETDGGQSAFHLYVVVVPGRDELRERLAARNIETRAYYTTPINRQPALRELCEADPLVSSDRLASDGLALPMGQCLDDAAVQAVVAELERALARS